MAEVRALLRLLGIGVPLVLVVGLLLDLGGMREWFTGTAVPWGQAVISTDGFQRTVDTLF